MVGWNLTSKNSAKCFFSDNFLTLNPDPWFLAYPLSVSFFCLSLPSSRSFSSCCWSPLFKAVFTFVDFFLANMLNLRTPSSLVLTFPGSAAQTNFWMNIIHMLPDVLRNHIFGAYSAGNMIFFGWLWPTFSWPFLTSHLLPWCNKHSFPWPFAFSILPHIGSCLIIWTVLKKISRLLHLSDTNRSHGTKIIPQWQHCYCH